MIRSVLFLVVLAAAFASSAPAQQSQRDPFTTWDKDGNGKLSREEVPERMRPNFERVDRNSDGFVTREELRAFASRWKARNRQPQTRIPENIEIQRDLDYVGDGNKRQMLDLVVPKERDAEGKLPLVVFIHGGGWRNGSKDGGIRRLAPLVASGDFAGATINYRLTGEATWPAQIHDCKAAIRFLRGNAKTFGIDPKKIAVMGSSAGGHLVSMLGTSGGVKELEGDLGKHEDESSRISCVVNFFGPQQFFALVGQESSINRRDGARYPEALLLGGSVHEKKELAKQASPVTWVSKDDPPFLTAHGTEDKVVPFPQGEAIHAALEKAKVESLFIHMVGAGHGFHSPELDLRIRAFLDMHLRGKKSRISDEPIEVKKAR